MAWIIIVCFNLSKKSLSWQWSIDIIKYIC